MISEQMAVEVIGAMNSINGLAPIPCVDIRMLIHDCKAMINNRILINARVQPNSVSQNETIENPRTNNGINFNNGLGENLEMEIDNFNTIKNNGDIYDKNDTFWIDNELITINDITNIPVKNIVESAIKNDHFCLSNFEKSLINLPKSTAKTYNDVIIDRNNRYKFQNSNMPAMKCEEFSLKLDGMIINVPHDDVVKKVTKPYEPAKDADIPIIVGYTNINDPKFQIHNTIRCFPETSIYCFSEINVEITNISNYTNIPNGYKIFHHQPYSRGNHKYIFSLIVVKDYLVNHIKQIKSSGPFTTIKINYSKFEATISTFYKFHQHSIKANIANVTDVNGQFIEWFTMLCNDHSGSKNSIICGDLNAQYDLPRKGEEKFINTIKSMFENFENIR